MHHIDRTLQEMESGPGLLAGEYETGYELGAQDEYGREELGQEFGQEFSNEYGQELGQEFGQEYAQEGGFGSQEMFESPQQQELEMAYQLLEVSNEQELNQFLGALMQKAAGAAAGAASRFVASPAGKSVGQYLVNFGKNTLPQLATQAGGKAGGSLGGRLGAAVGGRLGATGARLGTALGTRAGSWAGSKAGQWAGTQAGDWLASNAQRVFGLELEALSPENQELEIARSFVRFAGDVTRRASQITRQNPGISIAALGKQVLISAAPLHAPGLMSGAGGLGGRRNRGSWVRRGNSIVLYGA
ncbi:hypothetical protein EJV47_05695 [Hymenobacter gummosus]|uniref:Uncharacterized protein n=1 Tax=Hymenobacter gummosus TaxID=1776032 RepID=A0A3S0K7Z6_9BACT|nr:hypothetical protein [Hymenobacter gummosus]RTQ52504.1 hypothetical protein EJV47_05695 [Hymenobacter gummosus]